MTERELLEMAAKAAGIEIGWIDPVWNDPDATPYFHLPAGKLWNPLTDDGDALRLLAARGLHVSWEYKPGHVLVEDTASNHHAVEQIIDGDRASALRRAATACMAEVGRAMP